MRYLRGLLVVVVTVVVALVGGAVGCNKTLRASVTQPNPLAHPNEILYQSEPVEIITRDMELVAPRPDDGAGDAHLLIPEKMPLHNIARFTIVSRDRLRFHLQIEHKWEEWADVSTWRAHLIDDRGRVYRPEAVEKSSDKHVVVMWDMETRSVQRNRFGDIVRVNSDGWKRRQPLGSLSLFRGRGDFVFYAKDLFHRDVRSLTLVVDRGSMAFQFTWKFTDDDIAVAAR
jgi:hypothetical protein